MVKTLLLSPWWISGFADAESCFRLSILKNNELNVKWYVRAFFQIRLHRKDIAVLEAIRDMFGVGKIYSGGKYGVSYEVYGIKDLSVIVSHFDRYPLITQKRADFELFKLALNYMLQGEHLNLRGLNKIISIKASINKGLSKDLMESFHPPQRCGGLDIIPVSRPLVTDQNIPDPNWLAGFTSGEGCFVIRLRKSLLETGRDSDNTNLTDLKVELMFQVTQHIRDEKLLVNISDYLGCGRCRQRKGGLAGDFYVGKFSDILQKIIPFFDKYPIIGLKSKNYEGFKQVTELKKISGKKLSSSDIELIKQIKINIDEAHK